MAREVLDKQITIQRPSTVRDLVYNTPSADWVDFATDIFASVKDFLPSRAERVADGINLANRPARIRIRYRAGITPGMRILFGSRILLIVAGPAELGRRDKIELIAEEISTTGGSQ